MWSITTSIYNIGEGKETFVRKGHLLWGGIKGKIMQQGNRVIEHDIIVDGMENKKMTIEEGITHGKEQLEIFGGKHAEFIKMAIRSLEMQKKLAEYSGMDICKWCEDYDYDEENISEYEYETSVDNFLINEVNTETEEEWQW